MLMDILNEETTIGLNEEKEFLAKTVSSTISEGKPPVAAVPCKDKANAMSLTETADIISETNATQMEPAAVCKITVEEPVCFDIRSGRIKPIPRIPACKTAGDSLTWLPACKIPEDSQARPSACKIAKATRSAGKTADIVYLYFSDDGKKSNKINIMKLAKDEVVYLRNGRRRNPLQRWLSCKTDEALKARARTEVCGLCNYTTSKRQMHTHVKQHFTKHFCTCGYNSASYDSVYRHQIGQSCTATKQDIHEVDKHSYPRFLRFIKWKTSLAFGTRIPTLDGEGRRTLTYRRSIEPRKPIKERLGRRVDVSGILNPETGPELEYLRAQADWLEKEANYYRERIGRWKINRQF